MKIMTVPHVWLNAAFFSDPEALLTASKCLLEIWIKCSLSNDLKSAEMLMPQVADWNMSNLEYDLSETKPLLSIM